MTDNVFYTGQIIWAQIDANRHMRHSAYADICAQARSNLLNTIGFSLEMFGQLQIGPVLFREELIYHREIHLDENVSVTVELQKLNKLNSRFSFVHYVFREDGTKCCTVHVDGAWMDLKARKLTKLPDHLEEMFEKIPKSIDIEIIT